MDRIQVRSSNIRSIGYDQKTQTLEVEFLKGGVYQYFDVPWGTWLRICSRRLKRQISS